MKIKVLKGSEEIFALDLTGAAADDVRKLAAQALSVLLDRVASEAPGVEVGLLVSRDGAEEMGRHRALLAGRARVEGALATREERAAKEAVSVKELRRALHEKSQNEGALSRQISDLAEENRKLQAQISGVPLEEEESVTTATGVPGM